MFNGKMKALTFSYDDGITQDIRFIELLDKYGLRATFNICSDLLGKSGTVKPGGVEVNHTKVNREDVREIYKNHEIAVHTLTHPHLTELGKEEIIREVEQDRLSLSELAGYEVVGMAYPYGAANDEVAKIIAENTGVKYSRTTACTKDFEPCNNLLQYSSSLYHLWWDDMMKLGREFVELKPDSPKVFYVWAYI